MVFLQEQKTQLLYNDTYTLYSRKQSLEADRDLYKDIVTVISDFSIPIKRDNGLLFYAKKLVPAFLIITLIFLIILANIKNLNMLLRKY
jgi:hypothetical protein